MEIFQNEDLNWDCCICSALPCDKTATGLHFYRGLFDALDFYEAADNNPPALTVVSAFDPKTADNACALYDELYINEVLSYDHDRDRGSFDETESFSSNFTITQKWMHKADIERIGEMGDYIYCYTTASGSATFAYRAIYDDGRLVDIDYTFTFYDDGLGNGFIDWTQKQVSTDSGGTPTTTLDDSGTSAIDELKAASFTLPNAARQYAATLAGDLTRNNHRAGWTLGDFETFGSNTETTVTGVQSNVEASSTLSQSLSFSDTGKNESGSWTAIYKLRRCSLDQVQVVGPADNNNFDFRFNRNTYVHPAVTPATFADTFTLTVDQSGTSPDETFSLPADMSTLVNTCYSYDNFESRCNGNAWGSHGDVMRVWGYSDAFP